MSAPAPSAPRRLVVLISGRGRNLLSLIQASRSGELGGEIVRVIANRADAAGLAYAEAAGIPVQVISHRDHPSRESFDAALVAAITPEQPDLVLLAGFMRVLTPVFIRAFEGRVLNIHPSLLPRHPGLHTHAAVLAAGEREHGASVHLVTEELDGGPVLMQGRIEVQPGDDADRLAARVLDEIEMRLYPRAVALVLQGRFELQAGARPRFDGHELTAPIALD